MAQTTEQLRALAAEFPDAIKWWIGDWLVAGERHFGVEVGEAESLAKAAAFLSPLSSGDDEPLPAGVEADATSLSLASDVTRADWKRIGGYLLFLHADVKDIPDE